MATLLSIAILVTVALIVGGGLYLMAKVDIGRSDTFNADSLIIIFSLILLIIVLPTLVFLTSR